MLENNNASINQKLLEALMRLKKSQMHHLPPIEGLNHSEVMVLFFIKKALKFGKDGVKVSEISKHMLVTTPTTTQAVNKLAAGGYVQKSVDKEDGRVVRINLTAKGEEVVIKAKEHFDNTINGFVAYLGEEKTVAFIELLNEANSYLRENLKKS